MESEDGAWESMRRMVDQESMWRPGVEREEVRAALEQLYRTGDPSCLKPFLMRGLEDGQEEGGDQEQDPEGVTLEKKASETSIYMAVESEKSLGTQDEMSFGTEVALLAAVPPIIKVEPSEPSPNDPSDQCDLCEYKPSQPSKKTIRVHKDSVHFGLKHLCLKCNKVCSTRSNLLKHVEIKHSGNRHKCTECKYESHAKDLLKHHIQSNHSGEEFSCKEEECDFKTGFENSFTLHQMKHEEYKYRCIVCHKTFPYIVFLKEHIIKSHFGIFCDTCFYQPYLEGDLQEHNKKKHGSVFYPCQRCKLSCFSELHLKWHIKNNHKKKLPIIKPEIIGGRECNLCDYKPSKRSLTAIRIHKEAVHLGVRHICPQCQHPCTTRSNLKRHIAEKHEGRSYTCSSCSFSAPNSTMIKRHNESQHLGILYYCNIYPCNFSAESKLSLYSHNKNKHSKYGGMKVNNTRKSYQCSKIYSTICKANFNKNSRLQEHHRVVHEGLGYDCDICDFKTENIKWFDRHMQKHAITKTIEHNTQIYSTEIQEETAPVSEESSEKDMELEENPILEMLNELRAETNSAVDSISGGIPEQVQCPHCSQTFGERTDLMEHLSTKWGCVMAPNSIWLYN